MRPTALYQVPFSLVFASFFCGVAALRDVEEVLTVTELPDALEVGGAASDIPPPQEAALPEPCAAVRGSKERVVADGTTTCFCDAGSVPLDGDDNFCFELGYIWLPPPADQSGRCSCQLKTCTVRVYEAIFNPEVTADEAKFPNALPYLEKEDLLCLASTVVRSFDGRRGDHLGRLGEVSGGGITESILWKGKNTMDNVDVVIMRDVEFQVNTDVWTIGDLNGRLGSLRKIHKDWQTASMRPYIVGLGNMIDLGNRQLEVLAGMIAWRAMYPNRVSFTRGSHETTSGNEGFECVDDNFNSPQRAPYKIKVGFGPEDPYLNVEFKKLFYRFPAAIRIRQPNRNANAVFLSGGFGPFVLQELLQRSREHHRHDEFETKTDSSADEIVWSRHCEDCPLLHGDMNKTSDKESLSTKEFFLKRDNGRDSFGWFRTHEPTRRFMKFMESCLLMTGSSHLSTVQTISPNEGGECSVYTQAVTLSAHKFFRWSDLRDTDVRNIGYVGIISFEGGNVKFTHRRVFDKGKYDIVSNILDVGTVAGPYPDKKDKCHYLTIEPGSKGLKCRWKTCPELMKFSA